ncbi:MAG: hypothetical protein ACRDN0_27450 [Trebonia sp.]
MRARRTRRARPVVSPLSAMVLKRAMRGKPAENLNCRQADPYDVAWAVQTASDRK